MDHDFFLPIIYNNTELEFPARLAPQGFVVRLEVEIENTVVSFERDEEGNWRAVMGFEDLIAGKKIKVELLKLIAEKITELTA